jgi:hypothetical protein
MPIYELLKRQGSFEPEQVVMLCTVFEDVLQTIGLINRQDPMTEIIAKRLIEIATAGIREPDRLKRLVLQAFQAPHSARAAEVR